MVAYNLDREFPIQIFANVFVPFSRTVSRMRSVSIAFADIEHYAVWGFMKIYVKTSEVVRNFVCEAY